MTCKHGDSEIVPLPCGMTEDEWMKWLGLPNTEQGRAALKKIPPEKMKVYARMRAVERELDAGRVPKGVIVCDRRHR